MGDLASQIEAYIKSVVEADGSWVVIKTDVKLDDIDAAAVEVEFGLAPAIDKAKGLGRPLQPGGRCRIYIEQTRTSSLDAAADGGPGDVTLYEYDLIDEPYGFELAYHYHAHFERPLELHGHIRELGGDRKPIDDPQEVELQKALADFVEAVWRNRFP